MAQLAEHPTVKRFYKQASSRGEQSPTLRPGSRLVALSGFELRRG